MEKAQVGNVAKIHYTIKLPSGQVVGTSKGQMPLSFTIGKGKVLKCLEEAIIGMQAGDSTTIEVAPEDAYGHRNEDLVMRIEKKELPTQEDIAVGRTLQYMAESGGMVNLIITEVGEDTVTLDANHPFAGHTLIYEVELVALS